jgi:microcystin-dependent protein
MATRVRPRLTYANVVATLALFLALGGSSYAALSLTGDDIMDGTIGSLDVANNSLRGIDIENGSIRGAEIRDRTLTGDDMFRGSITGQEVANATITGDDIENGTLAARDFGGAALRRLAEFARGPEGPEGAAGAAGPAGPAGPPGETGPPGSDAEFNGAAAGGALTGTYPNPVLAADAVAGSQVLDGSLGESDLADGVFIPVGGMALTAAASSTSPCWQLADGSALERAAYPALFTALGGTDSPYGLPTSTSFTLPDLRGRVAVGRGTDAEVNSLADNDGLGTGQRKLRHRHGMGTLAIGSTSPSIAMRSGGTLGAKNAQDLPASMWGGSQTSSNSAEVPHAHTLTGQVGDTTGPLDGPAYQVVNYLIRAC